MPRLAMNVLLATLSGMAKTLFSNAFIAVFAGATLRIGAVFTAGCLACTFLAAGFLARAFFAAGFLAGAFSATAFLTGAFSAITVFSFISQVLFFTLACCLCSFLFSCGFLRGTLAGHFLLRRRFTTIIQ